MVRPGATGFDDVHDSSHRAALRLQCGIGPGRPWMASWFPHRICGRRRSGRKGRLARLASLGQMSGASHLCAQSRSVSRGKLQFQCGEVTPDCRRRSSWEKVKARSRRPVCAIRLKPLTRPARAGFLYRLVISGTGSRSPHSSTVVSVGPHGRTWPDVCVRVNDTAPLLWSRVKDGVCARSPCPKGDKCHSSLAAGLCRPVERHEGTVSEPASGADPPFPVRTSTVRRTASRYRGGRECSCRLG